MKIDKTDLDLDLIHLEEAGSLAVSENQATQQLSDQVSAMSLTNQTASPCPKHSPGKATTLNSASSPGKTTVTLNESFPKADLDLASSTDSCSESESETDSDDSDSEVSDNTLEKVNESRGSECATDESLVQECKGKEDVSGAKEEENVEPKLSAATKCDSSTLNF